jgi:hypothetical protein
MKIALSLYLKSTGSFIMSKLTSSHCKVSHRPGFSVT